MNQRYLGATLFCFALTAMGQEKKPVAYPEVAPGTGGLSYFLIGNSLTWDTVPSKLDGDVQWHVDCGKSLPFIYENPQKPCVKTSTLWPGALKQQQYDWISLQVHYGSILQEDAAVIGALIELQPDAVVVIHSGWARMASRDEEYRSTDVLGTMQHSPAYVEALMKLLRELYPERDFRQTHAQDILQKVAEDVKAGKAPFTSMEEVYRDKIHMNTVTGRYLMHQAMRRALGQPSVAKWSRELPREARLYFDGVLDAVFGTEKR